MDKLKYYLYWSHATPSEINISNRYFIGRVEPIKIKNGPSAEIFLLLNEDYLDKLEKVNPKCTVVLETEKGFNDSTYAYYSLNHWELEEKENKENILKLFAKRLP